jgi:hypothetical protein
MPAEIAIPAADDLKPLRISGARNTLYLDPEARSVYLFSDVGSGVPMPAFEGREIGIAAISADAVPETIEDTLREYHDEIAAIADFYLGAETRPNGNRVGRWDETAVERADELGYKINDSVATYWDASDWLYAAENRAGVAREIIRAADVAEWVEQEIDNARDSQAYLAEDDLRDEGLDAILDAITDGDLELDEARQALEIARPMLSDEGIEAAERAIAELAA